MPAFSPYPIPETKRKWHSEEELSDLSDAESLEEEEDLSDKLDECLNKLDELIALLKPKAETFTTLLPKSSV